MQIKNCCFCYVFTLFIYNCSSHDFKLCHISSTLWSYNLVVSYSAKFGPGVCLHGAVVLNIIWNDPRGMLATTTDEDCISFSCTGMDCQLL